MIDAKIVNLARLMTTYNFEIEQLPDYLKCAQCKLVLKDACQLPCCCRYCRICIDDMMTRGSEFCPGGSEDCGESLLSHFTVDYAASKGVSKLSVKCPHDGCVHEGELANMEKHLRECPRKKDIETLKYQLVVKDGQIRSIMDLMIRVDNDIKSIKEENENIAGRVKIMTEQIDREIAGFKRLIGSTKDELASEIKSLRGNIGLINEDVQSMKDAICSVKLQRHSTLVGYIDLCADMNEPAELKEFDAKFEWLIDVDVDKTSWRWGVRQIEFFSSGVLSNKFQLASVNTAVGTVDAALSIQLRIYKGPNDGQLAWPFGARVVITVSDTDRRDACRSISRQCQIKRPSGKLYSTCSLFKFLHSELKEAGVNLSRGVCVFFGLVLGDGQ